LTALTRPVGTSTTTDATTSEPSVPMTTTSPRPVPFDDLEIAVYPVPAGSRPHDVAPAADRGVWYTAQRAGALGHLDPVSGRTRHIALGAGSAPHGVIVDDEGIAWVTDGGLNAIVSVDPDGDVVTVFPLPETAPDANLNTAAFAADGRLWFTGQAGFHGVLDPNTGEVQAFESPRGRGPYGIAATPDGGIFYASLAGSYVGAVGPMAA
jgi:virginiamycin B lyase